MDLKHSASLQFYLKKKEKPLQTFVTGNLQFILITINWHKKRRDACAVRQWNLSTDLLTD